MPNVPPPATCPGTPVLKHIRAGTVVFRIHEAKYAASAFNSTAVSDPYKGSRFDSNDGSYAYLYAAESKDAAVAAVFVRDIPADGAARVISQLKLHDRLLTRLELAFDVPGVSLEGPDVGHVGQDSWLTKCESQDYVFTRTWAASIRRWAPAAAGFVWRSKRDESSRAYVFFDDRLPSPATMIKKGRSQRIDHGRGLAFVRKVLARHNIALGP